MGKAVSFIDIMQFDNIGMQEKREIFFLLDLILCQLHKKNLKVDSFNPKDIYYQDGLYYFSKVSPINKNVESKSAVILDNISKLANLAFCCYLPSFDLNNNLLNSKVLSESFDRFGSIFKAEDKDYYRSILVDSYNSGNLPDIVYYSDYVKEKGSKNNDKQYVFATEAGKLYLDEDAFGKNFFFACMVMTMIIAFIGIAICLLK